MFLQHWSIEFYMVGGVEELARSVHGRDIAVRIRTGHATHEVRLFAMRCDCILRRRIGEAFDKPKTESTPKSAFFQTHTGKVGGGEGGELFSSVIPSHCAKAILLILERKLRIASSCLSLSHVMKHLRMAVCILIGASPVRMASVVKTQQQPSSSFERCQNASGTKQGNLSKRHHPKYPKLRMENLPARPRLLQ